MTPLNKRMMHNAQQDLKYYPHDKANKEGENFFTSLDTIDNFIWNFTPNPVSDIGTIRDVNHRHYSKF